MRIETQSSATTERARRSLAGLVAERARERPSAIALEDGDRAFSYAEVDRAAQAIAGCLIAAGVEAEEPVGICLPRSWQAVCAMLGTLRAGAAYLPVNPDHPPRRRLQLLELAGARHAFVAPGQGERLPAGSAAHEVEAMAFGELPAETAPAPGGERLAYVLFTSGSTGVPKGVEVTHANFAHLLRGGSDVVAREGDVVLHVGPLDFDLSALEIWGSLTSGARLVVAPAGRPDPAALGRLIAARGVTFLNVSTGLLHELARVALPDLAGLRLITVGGDVLSPRVAARLRAALPHVRLLNTYGPTEATVMASSHEVLAPDEGSVPIGRALPGYRLHVLGELGRPVAEGEAGELWIGGPGVARGYRNDPERTRAAFRPDPFGDGGVVYRSGDRVRRRADGELLFLGRVDDQVKISGQRVEPGEVARALASHADVADAAVVAREDVPGHKRLVGYAAARHGAEPAPEELRGHLRALLPAFMVPGAIVVLDSLPRTDRGKLDHGALPPPVRDRPSVSARSSDPIAEEMAKVLRIPSVAPDEDFFALGGTSLLAIQLVGRLRQRLGVEVGIGAVFEAPTPAGLASALAQSEYRPPPLPPLRAGERSRVAPASAAQRRAWLFGRMHPDSIAYQFAAVFRFEGELDETALAGALAELLERHEILRTSFAEREGELVQVVHARRDPPLERIDLRQEAARAWASEMRRRIRSRIDPGDAPLVRWTLARLGERSWALLHVEHHLIHDGWSVRLLADELAQLYSARVENRPAGLPEPSIQFQDYARWEREVHGSPAVRRQIEHWAGRLDPNPPLLTLPESRPRPARESFAGSSVRRRVGAELTERLRSLARESGSTLFIVSLAAFLAQLRRYSGRGDIQIGSGVANRRDPATERLIGMVVNTVPLRCDLGGDPDLGELIERVRRAAVEAYANADAPFEAVVGALRPRRDPSRSPLIQALFSFNDTPRGEERWAGLQSRLTTALPNGTAKADLNVIGIPERDGGLTFVWEHSDLIDDAAADRLAGHHLQLLEQLARRPRARLSELELLTGEERAQLASWRSGPEDYERAATVHELVGRQAARRPGELAILDGENRLSYERLLARARSVAGRLQAHGVDRGDRVGVLLHRSAGSVTAKLGVLLAGAAYVPLDPLHPPSRLSRALADAGARVVLSDAELGRELLAAVDVLDLAEALDAPPGEPVQAGPDDLAYVVYTSGSTGAPKGVEVTHRNVVRLVDGPDYADLGPGRRMLHAASPAFDATTLELWGPLANGGAVVPLAEHPSPEAVAAAIERQGVDVLWLTAGLFHALLDSRPGCLASVGQLLAGGDVLSPAHVRRALRELPAHGRLVNGYGPTETTTFALTHTMRPGDAIDGPVPIGRPVQGTTCTVLDADGQEAPIGVPGELWIGGDGVARGYRGDAELTAARFLPDARHPGGRVYRSGDRVRRRADGALEFLGRLDRQVKIRGVRVEPAEVEEALRGHPGVADAAVVPYERAPGDLSLAAYFVPAGREASGGRAALRAHVAGRLPEAMVPTAWIELPELPLGPTGKVDRARLPRPRRDHLAGGAGARPRGRRERRVVRAFEEVLGVRPVGVEDDFFALGGHSLLAVALFAELERIAGQRLPLATIFEAPTPRALAARLGERAGAERGWQNLIALKPGGSRPPLFVVSAGDGNIVGFAPLARNLSDDQPLYALQPAGIDGRRPLDEGIEAMASRYVEHVRSVRPHGPYLLAGRCNGATVAYEMAQQLRRAGEEVPLLVSLDSDPPPAGPFELLPGLPYDQVMEAAWIAAREMGEEVPDLEAPGGPAALARWLRQPLAAGVSRYLHEFWRCRWDLVEAWPDPLGADATALAAWAWEDGVHEGLVAALLAPAEVPGCRLPDGGSWDWALSHAWAELGRDGEDPLSPPGWSSLRDCLVEPVAEGVNRYLLAAWRREDLRAAFPDPTGADARSLLAWAWEHGVEEGLQPGLLPRAPRPLAASERARLAMRPLAVRGRTACRGAARGARALGAEARARAIEGVERLLDRPLPGARWRIERRVLAAARRARSTYRAEPWPGRVVLFTSIEFADKRPFAAWRERARDGVEVRPLPVGHVEMLREPGAALLARGLEACVEEALQA